MPSQRLKQKAVIQASSQNQSKSSVSLLVEDISKNEETKVEQKLEVEDDNGIQETPVGKGIAQALKVFRERGMLGRDFHRGRTKDKTLDEQLNQFSSKTIPDQKPAPQLKEVDL